MFITLECPSGDGDTEMEQVATRGASPGQERSRLRMGRRPACVSCQTRKLRCTGRIGNCDRCRTKSIACVFPSTQAKNHSNHDTNGPASSTTSWSSPLGRSNTTPTVETVLEPPNLSKPPSPQNGERPLQDQGRNLESQGGTLFDMNFENLLVDIEEITRSNSQIRTADLLSAMDPQNISDLPKPLTPQSAPISRPHFSLDPLIVPNEPATEPAIRDPLLDGFSHSISSAPSNDPIMDTAMDSSALWAKNDGCSCMYNTVRVVQQLDDDDFRITTLSLGQVLQLQKWIIAQCLKPLDCVNCKLLPTVHTLLVISCDRLTEMFECIHKRIKKANQRISGLSDSSDQSSASSSDSVRSPGRLGELYCTSSRDAASKAKCNPELFASDFQSMYSNEEQVHIISVLLKLQVRNFRALLMRVGNASQITGSEARTAKVKSILIRLSRAASDIDGSLRAVLQFFAVSHP
ncbi:hypothetical protein BJX61DRAFT_507031 [Aspergillus egyptiacus]|nr:hypothetical protein BJX61DRAFT_507031 [Aspergillus egyptiacus]